jgi:hypothetical protein
MHQTTTEGVAGVCFTVLPPQEPKKVQLVSLLLNNENDNDENNNNNNNLRQTTMSDSAMHQAKTEGVAGVCFTVLPPQEPKKVQLVPHLLNDDEDEKPKRVIWRCVEQRHILPVFVSLYRQKQVPKDVQLVTRFDNDSKQQRGVIWRCRRC